MTHRNARTRRHVTDSRLTYCRRSETRLKGTPVRDEELQAREIVETLEVLDVAGVTGAFVHTFVDYQAPANPVPKYDLDISSMSLVKLLKNGRSSAYPDLPWEPKQAFRAVADYYAER